jgi:electron transfer flavoprotein alpha subunit
MMLSSSFRSVAGATSSILKRSATAATSRLASTLVVSDPLLDDGSTPACTQSAVTAAGQLGQSVDLLVVSSKPPSKVPEGVTKIYHVSCGDRLAETVASSIQAVATSKDCNIVLGCSSKFGNTVIPRAAALLESSPITDILEIHDAST